MDTKTKGMIGVTAILADLTAKGFLVSLPVSEHSPFDLIISQGNQHKTVQVKYRELKDNTLDIKLASVWSNKQGSHIIPMNKDLIDILAIYCPDTKKCYYLNPKKYKTSVTLRVKSADDQTPKLDRQNLADDFLELPE